MYRICILYRQGAKVVLSKRASEVHPQLFTLTAVVRLELFSEHMDTLANAELNSDFSPVFLLSFPFEYVRNARIFSMHTWALNKVYSIHQPVQFSL